MPALCLHPEPRAVRVWLWTPARVPSKVFAGAHQAGVTIVKTLGCLASARDGDDTGAGDLDQTDLRHQRDEGVDLVAPARHLEHEAAGRRVQHAGAINVGEAQRLDAVVAGAGHLDQRQLALDVGAERGQVGDRMDGNQPVELGDDLFP